MALRRRAPPRAEHPVARVDGEVVTAEEVTEVAAALHLDPRAALDRAIGTHLLAREAARRGLVSAEDRQDVAWHARVQVFLQREVEARVTEASLPTREVEDVLNARRVELTPGELLQALHFVAVVRPQEGPAAHAAARERAARFRARLLALGGEHPTVDQFTAAAREFAGALNRAERLDPFDREGYTAHGRYVPEFAEHAWALTDDAPLSPVFETIYGEHVALRLALVPPAPRPRDEALAIVRRDMVVRKRAETLQGILEHLRLRVGARVSETALRAVDRPPTPTPTPAPTPTSPPPGP